MTKQSQLLPTWPEVSSLQRGTEPDPILAEMKRQKLPITEMMYRAKAGLLEDEEWMDLMDDQSVWGTSAQS